MKKLFLLILTFITLQTASWSFGFLFHPLRDMFRPGRNYDRKKCLTPPKPYYGHFISSVIQPDEIHNFFINELEPSSRFGIGKNLIQTEQRIIKVDIEPYAIIPPWKIHKVEACVPNNIELKASY
jgi:hypothetical protein